MTSAAAGGWWQRTRSALSAEAEQTDHFAPDGLDAHARTLQAALPLLFAGLIAFAVQIYMDGDTGWHLGAGKWIIANGAVPTTDPFSHTMPGKAWTAHEWLAEVLMVGADALRGWGGLAALFAFSAALTFCCWPARRSAISPHAGRLRRSAYRRASCSPSPSRGRTCWPGPCSQRGR
jgi:hypothetical protein